MATSCKSTAVKKVIIDANQVQQTLLHHRLGRHGLTGPAGFNITVTVWYVPPSYGFWNLQLMKRWGIALRLEQYVACGVLRRREDFFRAAGTRCWRDRPGRRLGHA
jgi:hypothetical protein